MAQATPTAGAVTESHPWGVERFGKYHLVRKLAEGGMAEIFLAKHIGPEGFERDLVVKRMLADLSSNGEFVSMFLDEARLAARLSHHNVVQIHDLGLEGGHYFIAMEYLPGEDFSTILRGAARKREFVPLPIISKVILEAAAGLHYAHEFTDATGKPLQIVHRDVSPSNIFVTYQGHVKMLDFGIAKAESRVSKTTAGTVKGKYQYMSPEQARGKNADRRVDVFALGINLYEAVTRTRPFSRETTLAIVEALAKGDFKPPRQIRPSIPEPLERVVLKAMATEVEDRYQTAKELADDLEAAMGGNVASTAQVASYVEELFGQERVKLKTRVPSLTALLKDGGELAETKFPQTEGGSETPGSLRTPSGQGKTGDLPEQGRSIARRVLPFALGSAGLVLAGGVIAYWALSATGQPEKAISPPPVRPVAVGTAPAPAPAPAVLVVSSEPPGAKISVDGEERGASPVTIEGLAAGPHQVVASLDGHASVEQAVTVGGPGERTNLLLALHPVEGELTPLVDGPIKRRPPGATSSPAVSVAKGKLSLDTEPWTLVYLGKRKLGETPLVGVPLPAGSHVLRLMNEAKGIDTQVEIEIKAGKSTAKKLRF